MRLELAADHHRHLHFEGGRVAGIVFHRPLENFRVNPTLAQEREGLGRYLCGRGGDDVGR
jgi:hypothetical protein